MAKQATKQATKQADPASSAKVPVGWSDETNAAAGGKKGEFFRFAVGAKLMGTVIGPTRSVKGKFGMRDVRDVETATGAVFTVEPKAFAKRILSVDAGTEIMLSVTGEPDDAVEGSAWTGRLLTKAGDVPF